MTACVRIFSRPCPRRSMRDDVVPETKIYLILIPLIFDFTRELMAAIYPFKMVVRGYVSVTSAARFRCYRKPVSVLSLVLILSSEKPLVLTCRRANHASAVILAAFPISITVAVLWTLRLSAFGVCIIRKHICHAPKIQSWILDFKVLLGFGAKTSPWQITWIKKWRFWCLLYLLLWINILSQRQVPQLMSFRLLGEIRNPHGNNERFRPI